MEMRTLRCEYCLHTLPLTHIGPCPHCGAPVPDVVPGWLLEKDKPKTIAKPLPRKELRLPSEEVRKDEPASVFTFIAVIVSIPAFFWLAWHIGEWIWHRGMVSEVLAPVGEAIKALITTRGAVLINPDFTPPSLTVLMSAPMIFLIWIYATVTLALRTLSAFWKIPEWILHKVTQRKVHANFSKSVAASVMRVVITFFFIWSTPGVLQVTSNLLPQSIIVTVTLVLAIAIGFPRLITITWEGIQTLSQAESNQLPSP
jgi:hypothetical protein